MQTPWAANETQPIPRTPAENTAPTIGSGKHPTGSAQRDTAHRTPRSDARNTRPQRGHTRGPRANEAIARPRPEKPAKRGNTGVERARILDPGPALMRWDACRGWQAFPRASDACDRDGSLLLLKSIAHPKGTRQIESVSADDVGRYAPPQPPATQYGLRILRGMKGLSNRIQFSFGRPALVVPRLLFSVCSPSPQKARALACPHRREESWCAGERQKARCVPDFHGRAFRMENALRARTAHKRGLSTSGTLHTRPRIDLEPLEEKGPPRWPKR